MEGWYKVKEPKQCHILVPLRLSQRVSPATVTYDGNSLDRHKALLWLRFAICGSRNLLGACHTGTPWPANQLFIHRSSFRSKKNPIHLPSACLLANFKLPSLKMEVPLKEVQCVHHLANIYKPRV